MIAALDVQYGKHRTGVGCALAADWCGQMPYVEHCLQALPVEENYVPGEFYKRELPPILQMLRTIAVPLEGILIDGYVWLDKARRRPGLGARLHDALEQKIPVIGVAKTRFRADDWSTSVLRGGSSRPLYITSAGIDSVAVARDIKNLQGAFRLPDLLRRADEIARRSAR